MSAAATLGAIARGERPDGLLQNCRLSAAGSDAYGIEAVAAQFRRAPLDVSDAVLVESGGTVAAVWADTALIGDAYDANVARVWRVGPGEPGAAEPRVDVPFDPDMAQARGGVFAEATDLPGVSAAEVERLVTAMRSELDRWTVAELPASRARAFLIRAAAGSGTTVGLFAVHAMAMADRTTAGFTYAALVIGADGARLLRDEAGEAALAVQGWTPRIA